MYSDDDKKQFDMVKSIVEITILATDAARTIYPNVPRNDDFDISAWEEIAQPMGPFIQKRLEGDRAEVAVFGSSGPHLFHLLSVQCTA